MTTLERIVLGLAFIGMIAVGGYSWYKVGQIRAWGREVIAFTDHIQLKHSTEDPPGDPGDHVPHPPPPPPF